ncbi:MAG: class I SAM-dependent methyltransferase [Saprospiraceae bacterium]
MFREEAKWIREVLDRTPLKGRSAVNLGSSTAEFRQRVQPHIHEEVIAPLEAAGVQMTHVDLKRDPGVDVAADLTAADFAARLAQRFDLVICANMLEHVQDIDAVIANILRIATPGAYLLLTVPRRYPLHFDPIDNGFRPRPRDLADLFARKVACNLVEGRVISIKDSGYYPVKRSGFPLWGLRLRFRYWIGRYYQVTGVLLKLTD